MPDIKVSLDLTVKRKSGVYKWKDGRCFDSDLHQSIMNMMSSHTSPLEVEEDA